MNFNEQMGTLVSLRCKLYSKDMEPSDLTSIPLCLHLFFFCYSALIECHVDAGRKEDATQISIATLAFTKSNVPSLYTTVLGLQVGFKNFDLKHVYLS